MFIKLKRILLFVLLIIITSNTHAELFGKITQQDGLSSVISTNDSKRDIFKSDLIYTTERLETSGNGQLQIETTNHQTITLDKDSSLVLNKYIFDQKNPELSQIFLSLTHGSLRIDNTTHSQSSGSLQITIKNVILESTYADFGVSATADSTVISVRLGNVRLLHNSSTPFIINAGQTFELIDQKSPIPSSKTINLLSNTIIKPENKLKTHSNSNRPRLESFSSYGKFLQALYLYRKAEEELRKAPIIVPDLPSEQTLSYTLINGGYEVINWGENLSNLELSNDQLNAMDLVKQQLSMTALKASEMELSSVQNILGVNFLSLLDILSIKQEELDKILSINNKLEDTTEIQKTADIQKKLLKYSIKNDAIGNDIIILGSDLGKPEITVTEKTTP